MTPKPLDNIKFSILNFIKRLVSKSIYEAIKIILNPCCIVTSTASWSCTATNVATLTITLSRAVNLLARGRYRVNVANGSSVRTYTGTFTDGQTISIASVTTPGGGGSVTITGNLLLSTDLENNDVGVFLSIGSITSSAPNCT